MGVDATSQQPVQQPQVQEQAVQQAAQAAAQQAVNEIQNTEQQQDNTSIFNVDSNSDNTVDTAEAQDFMNNNQKWSKELSQEELNGMSSDELAQYYYYQALSEYDTDGNGVFDDTDNLSGLTEKANEIFQDMLEASGLATELVKKLDGNVIAQLDTTDKINNVLDIYKNVDDKDGYLTALKEKGVEEANKEYQDTLAAAAATATEETVAVEDSIGFNGKLYTRATGERAGNVYKNKDGRNFVTAQSSIGVFSTPDQVIEQIYGIKPGDVEYDAVFQSLSEANGFEDGANGSTALKGMVYLPSPDECNAKLTELKAKAAEEAEKAEQAKSPEETLQDYEAAAETYQILLQNGASENALKQNKEDLIRAIEADIANRGEPTDTRYTDGGRTQVREYEDGTVAYFRKGENDEWKASTEYYPKPHKTEAEKATDKAKNEYAAALGGDSSKSTWQYDVNQAKEAYQKAIENEISSKGEPLSDTMNSDGNREVVYSDGTIVRYDSDGKIIPEEYERQKLTTKNTEGSEPISPKTGQTADIEESESADEAEKTEAQKSYDEAQTKYNDLLADAAILGTNTTQDEIDAAKAALQEAAEAVTDEAKEKHDETLEGYAEAENKEEALKNIEEASAAYVEAVTKELDLKTPKEGQRLPESAQQGETQTVEYEDGSKAQFRYDESKGWIVRPNTYERGVETEANTGETDKVTETSTGETPVAEETAEDAEDTEVAEEAAGAEETDEAPAEAEEADASRAKILKKANEKVEKFINSSSNKLDVSDILNELEVLEEFFIQLAGKCKDRPDLNANFVIPGWGLLTQDSTYINDHIIPHMAEAVDPDDPKSIERFNQALYALRFIDNKALDNGRNDQYLNTAMKLLRDIDFSTYKRLVEEE